MALDSLHHLSAVDTTYRFNERCGTQVHVCSIGFRYCVRLSAFSWASVIWQTLLPGDDSVVVGTKIYNDL